MEKPKILSVQLSKKRFLELILPWPIFALLFLFTYARFVKTPYFGFDFSSGRVTGVSGATSPDSLQLEDRLIQVGEIDMVEFYNSYKMDFIEQVHPGDLIPIVIERDGVRLSVDWIIPDMEPSLVFERIMGNWWIGYVFWLAGTVTLLFIRPRGGRRALLTAFHYLNAIWLGVGSGPSHLHIWNSASILASSTWFCIPIFLHLHWVFPKPFSRLPRLIWILLYVCSATLAILDWLEQLVPYTYYYGFFIAVVGSVLLLSVRWVLQKDSREDVRLLVFAIVLILLPPALGALLDVVGFQLSQIALSGSLLALPALPGVYFLVAYRQQYPTLKGRINRLSRVYFSFVIATILIAFMISVVFIHDISTDSNTSIGIWLTLITFFGAIISFVPFLAPPASSGESILLGSGSGQIEIRANRMLAQFLFFILVSLTIILVFFLLTNLISFRSSDQLVAIFCFLLFGIITVTCLPPFQEFIDRFFLGILVKPQDILMHTSGRITTCLEAEKLKPLLQKEILPSLLVRQSILLLDNTGTWEPLIMQGVSESQIPHPDSIPLLQAHSGTLIQPTKEEVGLLRWIRLVIPLELENRMIGLWLFGKRDPDDFYTPDEIKLFETLAKQIAVALTNIDQANRLRILYESNIDRQEEERKGLARMLHDQVLGQLAVLTMNEYVIENTEIKTHLAESIASIRRMISTLRPAMLTYGLWQALDELVDELSDRVQVGTLLRLQIPKSNIRFNPKVEEHLFRITQQACENALYHAQAHSIRVSGEFGENQVILVIEDDGIGLPFRQHDINSLIVNKHYGLAGMNERAILIGADFQIESTPGNGTRILIAWKPVQ